jgi:trimeric autotransporter adhesin
MHPFHFVRNRKLWFMVMLVGGALLLSVLVVTAQGPKPRGPQTALGTGFSYQGQVKRSGAPVNGACDFRFALYDALSLGTQVGVTQTLAAVSVAGGLFTVNIDFGTGAFTGNARWLDIQAACPSGGGYTPLTPRQALTPAPMALALPGLWTQQNATSPNLIGGYSGNSITGGVVGSTIGGGGLSGNANTITNSYAFIGGGFGNIVRGYGAIIGGGQYNQANVDFATVGGGTSNQANQYGATVGGGQVNQANANYTTVGGGYGNQANGLNATVGGGQYNQANVDFATVGGGISNQANHYGATVGGGQVNQANANYTTVGGGYGNQANGEAASVGGGNSNVVTGTYGTVGGGRSNLVTGSYSMIGGGRFNQANGGAATVGGGDQNLANADWATVGGGYFNGATEQNATVGGGAVNLADGSDATVGGGVRNQANGSEATVGGGYNNIASGHASTIPGGENNTASMTHTFAAGYNAQALHQGAFVWADSTNADFPSSGNNQFLVRASGGITLYSTSNASIGMALLPGSGSWSTVSDRSAKANFNEVDGRALLAQLATLPIQTWNYKTQDAAIRHIGPMAQDFHAAFGVGENDTTISTVDAQGVALAAIQGLYLVVHDKDAQLATQQKQIVELQSQNASVEARLTALEERTNSANPASNSPQVMLALGMLVLLGVVYRQHRASRGGR